MAPSIPLSGLLALATVALTAHAQTPAVGTASDPLDAKTSVPAVTYQSSFKAYVNRAADKPITWRQANDEVARIGGWRAYAREAQQPDPTPVPPQTTPRSETAMPAKPADNASASGTNNTKPMPHGHGGHGGHKKP